MKKAFLLGQLAASLVWILVGVAFICHERAAAAQKLADVESAWAVALGDCLKGVK